MSVVVNRQKVFVSVSIPLVASCSFRSAERLSRDASANVRVGGIGVDGRFLDERRRDLRVPNRRADRTERHRVGNRIGERSFIRKDRRPNLEVLRGRRTVRIVTLVEEVSSTMPS